VHFCVVLRFFVVCLNFVNFLRNFERSVDFSHLKRNCWPHFRQHYTSNKRDNNTWCQKMDFLFEEF
jgi:hypothetical protein